jgi:hypothetical protein
MILLCQNVFLERAFLGMVLNKKKMKKKKKIALQYMGSTTRFEKLEFALLFMFI